MRLAISVVALLGLPACTSAARHRAGKPRLGRPGSSLRAQPKARRQRQTATAGIQRIAEEQDGDFSETDETRQDLPLIEEIEPEAPLGVPEQLPEVDPMPEQLPEVDPMPEQLPEVDPMPEQLPEVDPMPEQLPEVDGEPMPEQLPETEVGEPTTPDLPVPTDLLTCESCLGPDAMGQIFAWFPKQGEAGLCLSGCGVVDNTPCFTGAVYSDENCAGIAEAMEQLEAPLGVPEQLPEVDPMPEPTNPIELPTNCAECLGGQYNWLSDGTAAGSLCFAVCPKLQAGWSCWPGTAFDETKCAELEAAMPEQLPEDAATKEPTAAPVEAVTLPEVEQGPLESAPANLGDLCLDLQTEAGIASCTEACAPAQCCQTDLGSANCGLMECASYGECTALASLIGGDVPVTLPEVEEEKEDPLGTDSPTAAVMESPTAAPTVRTVTAAPTEGVDPTSAAAGGRTVVMVMTTVVGAVALLWI